MYILDTTTVSITGQNNDLRANVAKLIGEKASLERELSKLRDEVWLHCVIVDHF